MHRVGSAARGSYMRNIQSRAPMLVLLAAPLLPATPPVNREALLNQYCLQCHSSKVKSGGLVLEGISAIDPSAHPETWEKVVRKIRAGEMPPPKMPRPDAAVARAFTSGLTSDLDAAARSAQRVPSILSAGR